MNLVVLCRLVAAHAVRETLPRHQATRRPSPRGLLFSLSSSVHLFHFLSSSSSRHDGAGSSASLEQFALAPPAHQRRIRNDVAKVQTRSEVKGAGTCCLHADNGVPCRDHALHRFTKQMLLLLDVTKVPVTGTGRRIPSHAEETNHLTSTPNTNTFRDLARTGTKLEALEVDVGKRGGGARRIKTDARGSGMMQIVGGTHNISARAARTTPGLARVHPRQQLPLFLQPPSSSPNPITAPANRHGAPAAASPPSRGYICVSRSREAEVGQCWRQLAHPDLDSRVGRRRRHHAQSYPIGLAKWLVPLSGV
ncbi:hypothetical protein K438DRAFT_1754768 [Mycena galopus ATCC 62051]|nr:hypothetical protein K438DRAFT_1754768 [Mycena galopus ATCC 62051]